MLEFLLKEIFEQRLTVANTFKGRISLEKASVDLEDVLPAQVARAVPKVCLLGCGTSYHAAMVARHWFEELAHIPCDVEIASEHRYRRFTKEKNTLVVAISQSGENRSGCSFALSAMAHGSNSLTRWSANRRRRQS